MVILIITLKLFTNHPFPPLSSPSLSLPLLPLHPLFPVPRFSTKMRYEATAMHDTATTGWEEPTQY